jgi:hypothetical protein
MNYDEALDIFLKYTETEMDCSIKIWVGVDGIFHDSEYPYGNDVLVCYCGISYSTDTGDWIVTPWLYTTDCAAVFKTYTSARKMALFWMNWMEKIYGNGFEEPDFETEWLAVKSNRSLLMILFGQEGEALAKELSNEEKDTNDE